MRTFFTPDERRLLNACRTRNEREVVEAILQELGPVGVTAGEPVGSESVGVGRRHDPLQASHPSAPTLWESA